MSDDIRPKEEYVIAYVAAAGQVMGPVPSGRFLRDYDPDWRPNRKKRREMNYPEHKTGLARFTDDLDLAMKFVSREAAVATWQMQSTVVPTRPDGRPNRPLTAYTVEVLTVEEAMKDA